MFAWLLMKSGLWLMQKACLNNIVSPYAPDPDNPAFKAHENDKTIPINHLTLNDTMTIKRVKALFDSVEKYIDIYQVDKYVENNR